VVLPLTPRSSTLFARINQFRTAPAMDDLEEFRAFYELAE
jgi:hypothetical protein